VLPTRPDRGATVNLMLVIMIPSICSLCHWRIVWEMRPPNMVRDDGQCPIATRFVSLSRYQTGARIQAPRISADPRGILRGFRPVVRSVCGM